MLRRTFLFGFCASDDSFKMLPPVDDLLAKSCGQQRPISLLVSHVPTQKSSRFVINKPYAIVGRHPACDLPLIDNEVSKQHVYLQVLDGRLFCVDQGSRRGVLWKDKPRLYGWLDAGHWIQLGPYRLTLQESVGEPDGRTMAARSSVPFLSKYKPALEWPAQLILKDDLKMPLQSQLATIGRSGYCNVELEGEEVSRFQACVVRTADGKCWLLDLLSRVGTKINRRRCQSVLLKHLDIIKIGDYSIQFQSPGKKELVKPVEKPKPVKQNSQASQEEKTVPVSQFVDGIETPSISTESASKIWDSIIAELPVAPDRDKGVEQNLEPAPTVSAEDILTPAEEESVVEPQGEQFPDLSQADESESPLETVSATGPSTDESLEVIDDTPIQTEHVPDVQEWNDLQTKDFSFAIRSDSEEPEQSFAFVTDHGELPESKLIEEVTAITSAPECNVPDLGAQEEQKPDNLESVETHITSDVPLQSAPEPALGRIETVSPQEMDSIAPVEEAAQPSGEPPTLLDSAPLLSPELPSVDNDLEPSEQAQDDSFEWDVEVEPVPEPEIVATDETQRAGQHVILPQAPILPSALIVRKQDPLVKTKPDKNSAPESPMVVRTRTPLMKSKQGVLTPQHVKLTKPASQDIDLVSQSLASSDFDLMDGLMQCMKQMQQEMMSQMRMNMQMMVEFMGNVQKQQAEMIRQELAQLGKLNKELLELKQSLLSAPAPVPSPPQVPLTNEPVRKEGAAKLPQSRSSKMNEKPKSAEKKVVITKSEKPSPLAAEREESMPYHSHAWISKRIAVLEQERLSRWEKMKTAVMGK